MAMGHLTIGLLRAAGFGCALSLVSIAGFAIGADTPTETDAAKSSACLSGPKGAAPQGERWFFRVERGTKKHCWYTRANTSRNVAARTPAAEPIEAADATQPAPPQPAPLQPSVANARAEVVALAFPAPPVVATQPAMTTDAPSRTLADRFSDHPNAGQPAQALPAGVAQPTPPAAAMPSPDNQATSLGLILVLIGSALALVGLAVGLITRFARPRPQMEPHDRWASPQLDHDQPETSPPLARNDDEQPTQWDETPMNWVRVAREHADRHDDEIEHLLSRGTRAR